VDPVAGYIHSPGSGPLAITGGVVVRDPALTPLYGRYVYADSYLGLIRSQLLGPASTDDRSEGLSKVSQIVNFGEDADGHVYVVSLFGSIYRLAYTPDATTGGAGGGGGDGTPPADQPPVTPPDNTPPPPPAPDRTPPKLDVRAAATQSIVRLRRVRVAVACDEPCTVRVGAVAGKLALRSVLEPVPAGRHVTFDLHPSARVLRALAHGGSVKLTIRGRDAAGNLAQTTSTVRARRR
jgi:hypothetical protein